MKDMLFNGHDVALALAIGISLLVAGRVLCNGRLSPAFRATLSAIFILNALMVIHVLLFWGDFVKQAAFGVSPTLPLSLSFASFAIGPALYWCVRGLMRPEAAYRPKDLLHLLPVLLTPVYLYWACYRFPFEMQHDLILDLKIFSSNGRHFFIFLTLKKLAPVVYGLVCLKLLLQCSAPEPRRSQLTFLTACFTTIWTWGLVTHILGQWLPLNVSDAMGIFGNYLSLTLCIAVLSKNFPELEAPVTIRTLHDKPSTEPPQASDTDALLERINHIIVTQRPFLNSQLTLERFADLLPAAPRQVSAVINRRFQQNFQEYINRLRVEEAKRLLHDSASDNLSIFEIAERAGFNSKPTFNRLFKSCVGSTPSEYRRQMHSGCQGALR